MAVTRTATIASSAPLSAPVDTVWIVLHGYAQLAPEFLSAFESAASPNVLFVAPEGLSRFYRRHRSDDIGASWMTTINRDDEIRDYIAYLNQVYDLILEQQGRRPVSMGILGFSQGSSTASRWVYANRQNGERESTNRIRSVDRLVLWGGSPALELRTATFQNEIAPCLTDWVTGTNDRFTPPEKLQELLPTMDSRENPIRFTTYDGKHEIEPATLQQILFG